MSSLGGQWRVIRHYLSLSNLNTEVEKLLQKIKPATPEQWESLIERFEKAVSVRLVQANKDTENHDEVPKSVTIEATTLEHTPKKEIQPKGKREDKEKGLEVGSEAKEITIEGFLQGLKLKKDLHFGKISEQSWKSNKPIITKTSIHSRTAYVISAIVSAETSECLLHRTEHLIDHLKQYPEARDYAIKEGAVRALLRVQRKQRDEAPITKQVVGVVNEALALMGYTGPTKGPGPNILSLDGGGIRGLIAIEILRHLERLTGRKVQDMFDYIIGVSTGAIIAAVIGSGIGNLDTANQMYMTLSKKMFGNTSYISGASRLVWTHSYYDTEAWEQLLQENLRDCTLTECNRYNTPKMALVSCVVNTGSRLSPFLFRSYECGFRVRSVFPGTSRARVWHAVRASAAAPTYFNEFKLEGLVHQDGGIMVNNPTGVGLHEAKLLFGEKALKNATIISVGTGQTLSKNLDYQRMANGLANDANTAGTSWKDKFNKILDSATDTEGCNGKVIPIRSPAIVLMNTNNFYYGLHLLAECPAYSLTRWEIWGRDTLEVEHLESITVGQIVRFGKSTGIHQVLNDLLSPGTYYRFNPPLMDQCAMDEVDPIKLNNLIMDTNSYIRRNQHKFEQAAAQLNRKRTITQRLVDYAYYQSQIMGVVRN